MASDLEQGRIFMDPEGNRFVRYSDDENGAVNAVTVLASAPTPIPAWKKNLRPSKPGAWLMWLAKRLTQFVLICCSLALIVSVAALICVAVANVGGWGYDAAHIIMKVALVVRISLHHIVSSEWPQTN